MNGGGAVKVGGTPARLLYLCSDPKPGADVRRMKRINALSVSATRVDREASSSELFGLWTERCKAPTQ